MSDHAPGPAPVLEQLVHEALEGLDVEVDAIETTSGRRPVVRVVLDRDGGVGIDQLTAATRRVSAALDADDPMGESAYTLEVTSRGLDRPLTAPRHWRRNRDRLARVTHTDGSTIHARIGDSDDDGVELGADRVAYADIARAVIEPELKRPTRKDA